MKKLLFIVLTVCLICSFVILSGTGTGESGQRSTDSSLNTGQAVLTVYAYDSFASEWGPGPAAAAGFERAYGIPVRLISAGDSGQVLQKAILEKNNPKADIVIGIDNNFLIKALNAEIFQVYRSPALERVPAGLQFDPSGQLTPYDYGFFSFIFDTEAGIRMPRSLQDLTSPEFRRKVIIMDPRTSSPGLGLLHWTAAQFGDDYLTFWEAFKPSLLTVAEGWDTGYGLFLAGEAPVVLSYTTSPAYHVEYESTERYQALIFEEGHSMQIEGAGILKGAKNPEAAKLFIDYLLSDEIQKIIPLTNWMYPAVSGIDLPDSFRFAPQPPVSLTLAPEDIELNLDRRLRQWTELMSR